MFSVEPAHARFDLTRLAGGQNRSPVIEQPRQVLRADRGLPPPTTGFLETQARVIAPALIERIDNTSELVLQRCVPLASDPRGHSACGTQGRTSMILSYRSADRRGAVGGERGIRTLDTGLIRITP